MGCDETNLDYHIAVESDLSVEEFVSVLKRSTLAERRPVDDLKVMQGMIEHADIIVTARDSEGVLIGIARSISDFSYCTYLSDLAVDKSWQRRGIGIQLIERTESLLGEESTLILLAAPAAEKYYPKIGFAPHQSCWLKKLNSKR